MKLGRPEFLELVETSQVIPAAKDLAALEKCRALEAPMVYILFGNICNIASIVEKVKEMGKYAIVHMDLIAGLAGKEISVDFIRDNTRADGIISTKPSIIKRAKERGLFTVQRFFMIDYLTYSNIKKHVEDTDPDVVDLLPAGLAKVIRYLCGEVSRPVIASGLVLDKEDIYGALDAGALAVSTTNQKLWDA